MISVHGELVMDTRNTISHNSWEVVVLEVGIPHSDGFLYDIIWEFKRDKVYWYDHLLNRQNFRQNWRSKSWKRKSMDSTYSPEPLFQTQNSILWGGAEDYNAWYTTDTYYSNGFRTPSNIPDNWIKGVLNHVDSEFIALWEGPNGMEDRAVTGDWFDTTGGISYSANAYFVAEINIVNWDERDANLPDQVTFTFQGSEFDYLWEKQDCFNGAYRDQQIIRPRGDGWYLVPVFSETGARCPFRKESGKRDHSLYVIEGHQSIVAQP